jgi:BMFP domain-containing protein YqiC
MYFRTTPERPEWLWWTNCDDYTGYLVAEAIDYIEHLEDRIDELEAYTREPFAVECGQAQQDDECPELTEVRRLRAHIAELEEKLQHMAEDQGGVRMTALERPEWLDALPEHRRPRTVQCRRGGPTHRYIERLEARIEGLERALKRAVEGGLNG